MTQTQHMCLTAAGVGMVAGMRSMAAPALLLRNQGQGGAAVKALAVMELLVDKSPNAPDRTALPSLLFRAASGGLSALAATRSEKNQDPATRAAALLIGSLSAVGTAYLACRLRKGASSAGPVSGLISGLAEDAITLGVGSYVFRKAAA